jgi:uncharacterized membrane protein YvlD (DUF360 family)
MGSISRWRAMEGWLAGCAASTGVLCAFALVVSAFGPLGILSVFSSAILLLLPALLIFLITGLMTAIPAAVVIWLSRRLQLHAAWFFGSTGAVIGGLSLSLFVSFLSTPESRLPSGEAAVFGPRFSVAGLVAGLTYWRVAGQYADERRSDAQVAP